MTYDNIEVITRIITLAAISVAFFGIFHLICVRDKDWREMLLILCWLVLAGTFMIDRIINTLWLESPIPDRWVHAWSITIRLVAALSTAIYVLARIYEIRFLGRNNEGDSRDE